jgi:hypothetical protein
MTQVGLRLRHLVFHGPNVGCALLEFGAGLNVLYGASESGKSFLVETVDFMLGGRKPLRQFKERDGYDRIFLGVETTSGVEFTLMRSTDGGGFKVYEGLYAVPPPVDLPARELADQHSDRNTDNLSSFLLEKCNLSGKRIRKNKSGDTISLSFRHLARLLIVTETEIIEARSPLMDGNPTADTPNFATFKLLLTGVDDSALVSRAARLPEDQSREAQIDLLDKLLGEQRDRLDDLTGDPSELQAQYERIQSSISRHVVQLSTTEDEFRQLADRRRELRKRLEEGRDRQAEILALLERFTLLDQHYQSDVQRLRGLEEGGTLFDVLGKGTCPLCGADAQHHRTDQACNADVGAIVAAARKEITKIDILRKELVQTRIALERESVSFGRRLPKLEKDLEAIAEQVEGLISPKLSKLRATYAQFADKRAQVREAMAVHETIQDIERRRADLENGSLEPKEAAVAEADLPPAVADDFAKLVESILKAWHFPDAERVFFDAKSRDLIIAAKPRAARGKGLRAITHAAFTIGLLQFCKSKSTPHPGFVILDSPLLAYRAPEGPEDDLTGTDLQEKFYEYLGGLPQDRQVIIVENNDPPADIRSQPQSTMFSKNPHSGRYGLFPMKGKAPESVS